MKQCKFIILLYNCSNRVMNLWSITCYLISFHLLSSTTLSALAIQKPTNIDAQRSELYNSSASIGSQQFTITFKLPFTSLPLFVFGINDYKLGDQFFIQNFQSLATSLSQTQVSINVISIGSTNVKTFSISYFAVQPEASFLSNFQNVTNGINISTYSTSSYRYYQIYVGMNFTTPSTYAFPLLTGYSITSSTYFQVNVTASVISTMNYKYKIETTSDCSLLRVTFYVLFCQKTAMDANNYYHTGGIDYVQSYNPTSASYFDYTVNKYTSTVFLLGLRGFSGFTTLSGCYWGWSVSSVTNDVATLMISQKQLMYIQFSFFQIGKYINTTDTGSTSSAGNSSYLPIIVGLVVGIILTAIIVVTFLKFYWRKAILNLPTHDDFREMPSIAL